MKLWTYRYSSLKKDTLKKITCDYEFEKGLLDKVLPV